MNIRESILPRISVHRPVMVTMILAALSVLGAVAYFRIPIKLMPSGLDPDFLYIRIRYENATPQETEQQITRPLEETLRAVKGVERLRTWSKENGTRARIQFREGTDIRLAFNEVVDRLDRLKPSIPEESRDRVRVYKWDMSSWNILWGGVTLDPSIRDPYQYCQRAIVRPLERIDGVGVVEVYGTDEKEVMVEIDQERLRARGLSIDEVLQSLRSDNFSLAGGYVREGQKKHYVRSVAKYETIAEMQKVKIRGREGAPDVPLMDVATVSYDVPERRWYQSLNGEPAVTFGVKQESGANIVETTRRVREVLAEIEQVDPGLAFNIFFDQGSFILDAVNNLQSTGLWGGAFAALILLYYLRTVRMTSIITLSIPLCLVITLTAIYFLGWSLNVITMMGLMVGVGMVVDNAIVILENIYRMRGKRLEPQSAAIKGASEVGLAITMATLTTVVVFLPLMLMGGKNQAMNFYLTRMGLPVVIALVVSLFVALIFIPLASVRFGGSGAKKDPGLVRAVREVYLKALNWMLIHRRDAALIVVATLLTMQIPISGMKRGDDRGRALNDFRISLRMPKHFSFEETLSVTDGVESYLDENRSRFAIRTIRAYYREQYASIQVFLTSRANEAWYWVALKNATSLLGRPIVDEMDRKEIVKVIREEVPKYVGVRYRIDGRKDTGRDPNVRVVLVGDDTQVLQSLMPEVKRRLATVPSVLSLDTEEEEQGYEEEVRVYVDRQRANRLGISAQDVARTIGFALQGVNLPRFQLDEREVQVRLYLERTDRQTLQQLKNFPFRTRGGEDVALAELASIEVGSSTGDIYRVDGQTRLSLRAFTTKDDLKALYGEIDRAMTDFEMPRGYSWNKGERFKNLQDTDDTAFFAVIMAITFVFLLMGVLFESFILPFCVLFSVPFAFLGVYWMLFLTGTPLNMMAMIGMIILVGVVVNNAIVLVDMVNRLRADGNSRYEAMIEAGRNRFRPILMTTFTTIFGLLPLAVGNSNLMGMPYAPLGRTMMGGLLSSTLLTLLVVPLLYTFLDDARVFVSRVALAAFFPYQSKNLEEMTAPAND